MPLIVDHPEADRLARELAARTGESLEETVIRALRERLLRAQSGLGGADLIRDLRSISEEGRNLPTIDSREADNIIGYDDQGLPR
jgi:antitoxin VapB